MSTGATGCILAGVSYLDLVMLVVPRDVAAGEAVVFVVACCNIWLGFIIVIVVPNVELTY